MDGQTGYVSDKDKTRVQIYFDVSVGFSKQGKHLLRYKMQKKELCVEGAVSVHI